MLKERPKGILIFLLLSLLIFGFPAGEEQSATVRASSFNIEQEAGTAGGTTKRHIDISSPWSGAFVFEDFVVKGRSEIKESFEMLNPGPSPQNRDWFEDPFGQGGVGGMEKFNSRSAVEENTSGSNPLEAQDQSPTESNNPPAEPQFLDDFNIENSYVDNPSAGLEESEKPKKDPYPVPAWSELF